MSAVLASETPRAGPTDAPARLHERYARLDATQRLAHFRARRGVTIYPILDPLETRPAMLAAILAGRFEFNGETHELGASPDWLENPSRDVEWQILLHKFYYAPGLIRAWAEARDARYLERWVALTASWIEGVPAGFIAPDVTGRRIQNWIYAHHLLMTAEVPAPLDPQFHDRFLGSLDTQVEFLCANLTPKRNHRTLELHAIFLAGVAFPELCRAAEWRRFALEALVENAELDLLPDGVHCELSTDYHHLVLKNYLCVRRLAAANGIEVPRRFDQRIASALEFSMHVHKPDGVVPSFSDGDARSHLELLAQGAQLYGREDWRYVASAGREGRAPAQTTAAFAAAGYYIVRSGWGSEQTAYRDEQHLVFDCGPLGEGNHGHFDCLSFELAAHGRSLIVDPGRYTYSEAGERNWRVAFRGTAAHNTVTVDELNQTRYAPKAVTPGSRHAEGSVRHRIAGPAPQATLEGFAAGGNCAWLRGRAVSSEYDAVHTRQIVLAFGEYWLIVDRLEAASPHDYAMRLQLDESAAGELAAGHCNGAVQLGAGVRLRTSHLEIAFAASSPGAIEIEAGYVSYRYGERFDAPRVCVRQRARSAWFHALLRPLGPISGETELLGLEIRAQDDGARFAAELRWRRGGTEWRDACVLDHAGGCRLRRIDARERAIEERRLVGFAR